MSFALGMYQSDFHYVGKIPEINQSIKTKDLLCSWFGLAGSWLQDHSLTSGSLSLVPISTKTPISALEKAGYPIVPVSHPTVGTFLCKERQRELKKETQSSLQGHTTNYITSSHQASSRSTNNNPTITPVALPAGSQAFNISTSEEYLRSKL